MSRGLWCKRCRQGRHGECRGYRNGDRALRCFCRHAEEEPARRTLPPALRPRPAPGDVVGMVLSARR